MDLRIIYFFLLISCVLFSCFSSKVNITNSELESNKEYNIQSKNGLDCDNSLIYVDCIYRKAFYGKSKAINHVRHFLEEDSIRIFAAYGKDYRLRGEQLFKVALNQSKVFHCELGIEWVTGPAFTTGLSTLLDMIVSVDNQEAMGYIDGQIKDYKLEKDTTCNGEMYSRAFWNELNIAWREGKIKLKVFGQE